LGKAFFEAGRQAVKSGPSSKFVLPYYHHSYFVADAKHSPQGVLGSDVAGVGNANTGSMTDQLTRQHRMTIDEANLILNVKREESMEQILKVGQPDSVVPQIASHSLFRIMIISSKLIHQHPSQINFQLASILCHHTHTISSQKCSVLANE